jgi:hypothetical protein
VSFGGFDCFLLFVVVGGRNKHGSSLLTFVLTHLKANTQYVCGFGCTLLNSTQVILNHFLTYNSSLKTSSQICNLLLYLNGRSLQIRSKQQATRASTKQHGTSFDLSEFQLCTIKQTCNMRMHQPQVSIVHHDHFAIITWFSTHIIIH